MSKRICACYSVEIIKPPESLYIRRENLDVWQNDIHLLPLSTVDCVGRSAQRRNSYEDSHPFTAKRHSVDEQSLFTKLCGLLHMPSELKKSSQRLFFKSFSIARLMSQGITGNDTSTKIHSRDSPASLIRS